MTILIRREPYSSRNGSSSNRENYADYISEFVKMSIQNSPLQNELRGLME
jgi:hypothetical protein